MTTQAAITYALRQIIAAYRADRAVRIHLNSEWRVGRLLDPVPDFENDLVAFRDSWFIVKPNDISDGNTLAPETIGRSDMRPGATGHDPLYESMEAIAKAWGWPISKVRKLMDQIMYGINLQFARTWIARTYYRFVRALGGLGHTFGKIALLLLLALSLSGCGGCASPRNPFDPAHPIPYPDITVHTNTAKLQHSSTLEL